MTNQEPGNPKQLPDPSLHKIDPSSVQEWGYQITQEPAKKSHRKAWIVGGVSAVAVTVGLAVGAITLLIAGPDDDSKKMNPDSWESNRDMMEGILAAEASCDSFTGEFDETSTCMNSNESSYLLGLGHKPPRTFGSPEFLPRSRAIMPSLGTLNGLSLASDSALSRTVRSSPTLLDRQTKYWIPVTWAP